MGHNQNCHKGSVTIFTYKGHALQLGGLTRGVETKGKAVIDLTGSFNPSGQVAKAMNPAGEAAFGRLLDRLTQVRPEPWLRLPVQDGSVPDMDLDDLRALKNDIFDIMAGGHDVVIFCQGGHGRTCTIAAPIAWLALGEKVVKPDPITWLRTVYCEEAVETQAQVDFVYQMCGLSDVPAKDRPKGSYALHAAPTTLWAGANVNANQKSDWMACRACKQAWHGNAAMHDDVCDACFHAGKKKADFPALTDAEKKAIIATAVPKEGQAMLPFPGASSKTTTGATTSSAVTSATEPKIVCRLAPTDGLAQHLMDGRFVGIIGPGRDENVVLRCPHCLGEWKHVSVTMAGDLCDTCWHNPELREVRLVCVDCGRLILDDRKKTSRMCPECQVKHTDLADNWAMPCAVADWHVCADCGALGDAREMVRIGDGPNGVPIWTCVGCSVDWHGK